MTSCQNLKQTPANQSNGYDATGKRLDKIQVNAFQSLFKIKVDGGMDRAVAFATAITQTSDIVFDAAKIEQPELIAAWPFKGMRR